ncbi:MAG: NAD(P)/FAD-dependent oxidoreductase [Actinomycetota bacterium]
MQDATVVGSGPNGLAAAITLARHGRRVTLLEGADTIGGGMRTEELTLPGFRHDVCSSVYPFASSSPFFRSLRLEQFGLRWVTPPIAVAHPLDDGTAAYATRSLRETAEALGQDGGAYLRLIEPLVKDAGLILRHVLGPLRIPPSVFPLARFGMNALLPARYALNRRFKGEHAKALMAGSAAHSMLSLDEPATFAFGLILTMCAHLNGWPFTQGGASSLADALASCLKEDGGTITTGRYVTSLDDLASTATSTTMLDLAPWNVLELAASLPRETINRYRKYRHGLAVVKVDYALDAPVPWTAEPCRRAGTVHLGGTMDEIAESESMSEAGAVSPHPFVLCAQPTLVDPTRAPDGKHILWAYAHVPTGFTEDVSPLIDAQIERFAPGFSSRILARNVMLPKDFEAHNPNLIGGDIGTGSQHLMQLLTRPALSHNPYATGIDNVYLCSAATPPGAGVHGMCGYRAALAALHEPLRDRLRRRLP